MSYLNHPNVRALLDDLDDEELEAAPSTTDRTIQEKIIHVLTLYPRVSGAMLQVGIGTSLPPDVWRPNFEKLKQMGLVSETQNSVPGPSGRITRHTFIELTSNMRKAIEPDQRR